MRKYGKTPLALLLAFSMIIALFPIGVIHAAEAQPINLALGRTVTAVSSYEMANEGWGLTNLVDGDKTGPRATGSVANGWTSSPTTNQPSANNPVWVMIDLGSQYQVDQIVLWPRNDGGTISKGVGYPVDFKVQISADKTTWIDKAVHTNYPSPTTGLQQTIDFNKDGARYVRVIATKLVADDWNQYVMQFREIEVFQSASALNDAEAVAADAAAIDLGNLTAIYKNLYLPSLGGEASNISWVSLNPSYLNAEGIIVKRPEAGEPDASVVLEALVKRGQESQVREFSVTVKAKIARVAEPDSFKIGIFWPPTWEFTNDEQYKYIKEANVTDVENVIGGGLDSEEKNLEMLELAEANGLKVSVADTRVNGSDRQIQEMVQTYMDHPATSGYYIQDEPGVGGLQAAADRYGKILAVDPDRVPYVNLLPEQAVAGYEHNYVRAWVEKAGPQNLKYLSFDNYPLLMGNSFSGTYFSNLEIIRKTGLEYGVKTSSYLQSIGIPGGLRRPIATEMDYLAYANMAYGMKSLVWFTYWTPTERTEAFTDAIIDAAGNKTDLYVPFQQINGKIAKLGQTLINLDAVQVYHSGPSKPAGVPSLPKSFFFQPEEQSDDLIISHLVHQTNGQTYIMIVNKSLTDAKQLSFSLDTSVRGIEEISNATGLATSTDFDPETGLLKTVLEAGEGKLYVILGSEGDSMDLRYRRRCSRRVIR